MRRLLLVLCLLLPDLAAACSYCHNVCTQSQDVCTGYSTQCVSYANVCNGGYSQQCDGYQNVCTNYETVCTGGYSQQCDGYQDVCTEYDEDGECTDYEEQCTGYSDVCNGYTDECTAYAPECTGYSPVCNGGYSYQCVQTQQVCNGYKTQCTQYQAVCAYGNHIVLSGVVRSTTGQPLANATVTVNDANSDNTGSTTTNAQGAYSVAFFVNDSASKQITFTACAQPGAGQTYTSQCATQTFADTCASDPLPRSQVFDLSQITLPADFGGAYGFVNGRAVVNPATNAQTCPTGYASQQIMGTSGVDYPIVICLRSHQTGIEPIFDFGGMVGTVNGKTVLNGVSAAAGCLAGYTSQQVAGTSGLDYPISVCYRPHLAGVAAHASFGGAFGAIFRRQTVNPTTGAYSCPIGYQQQQIAGYDGVDYPAFYCYQPLPTLTAPVDFGGAFGFIDGKAIPNPATGLQTCPAGYGAQQFLGTSGVDFPLTFCLRSHQMGVDPIYDFGGMWGFVGGKQVGNAAAGVASCPPGYAQQQVMGKDGLDYPLFVCFRQHRAGVPADYNFGGASGYRNAVRVMNPATGSLACPAGYASSQVYGTDGLDYPIVYCSSRGR